jgi:predicted DNA-binding protein
MAWASFRLTPEDRKKLDALAEKKGMTISEIIRDLIRNGYEQIAISSATEKIDRLLIDLGRVHRDTSRALQILSILGHANPTTYKQVTEVLNGTNR